MNKQKGLYLLLGLLLTSVVCAQEIRVYDVADFGMKANSSKNISATWQSLLKKINAEYKEGDSVVIRFHPGTYHFQEKGAAIKEYYISNHDQDNPKKVGISLEGMKHLTLDGGGASFVFHGRMLPISLLHSENCVLKNFSIDFANPHIAQVEIVKNDPEQGITFRPASWVKYRIAKDSVFEAYGDGWTVRHSWGIPFEKDTKRIVYNAGDRGCNTERQ